MFKKLLTFNFQLSTCFFAKRKSGFTLIEMLIVIAIIAILSSVFLVGLGGFRGGAQDARRISDLQKIQSYLELYYMKYRCYPYSDSTAVTTCSPSIVKTNFTINGTDGLTGLQKAFTLAEMGVKLPNDPLYDSSSPSASPQYKYAVEAGGQNYVLSVELNVGHSSLFEDVDGDDVNGISCKDPIFCVQP